MSVLLLIFCLHAGIFQIVYTQYIGAYPNALNGLAPGYGPAGTPYGPQLFEDPGRALLGGSYGGAGEGDVSVLGELPVTGTTLVAGQVPILGAVSFTGPIPAAGIIAVSGSCSCGARFETPIVY